MGKLFTFFSRIDNLGYKMQPSLWCHSNPPSQRLLAETSLWRGSTVIIAATAAMAAVAAAMKTLKTFRCSCCLS